MKQFIEELFEALGRGHRRITLDFSNTHLAYSDAVLPMICLVEHRRSRGDDFVVVLPQEAHLRQLFLNANWASLLDPRFESIDMRHPRHLPATRFLDHQGQQVVVNKAMDVALKAMELPRAAITALEWSLNEVSDNVLNHAQSADGGLVQVSTFTESHRVTFVVADGGRGIPVAMRDAFPRLSDDEALVDAIKRGVTSVPDAGQGNGLAGSLHIARSTNGSFKILSGAASLAVFRDERGRYRTQKGRPSPGHKFPGTAVMVDIRTDAPPDLQGAFGLTENAAPTVSDVVDLHYAAGSGLLRISLVEEAHGFGTRAAGRELRNKCLNLIRADPGACLVLDWAGVPLITSSFADEAVGKLFVALGPIDFGARVRLEGTDPLVRSLIDRAILQRAAQSVDRPGA